MTPMEPMTPYEGISSVVGKANKKSMNTEVVKQKPQVINTSVKTGSAPTDKFTAMSMYSMKKVITTTGGIK